MSERVKFQFPRIQLINTEIKEPQFYIDLSDELSKLNQGVSIKLYDGDKDRLSFFVHLDVKKNEDDSQEYERLIHFDFLIHLSFIESPESDLLIIEKTGLANSVGIGFIMIRGALSVLLRNHVFSGYQPPILNPLEMLEKKLRFKKDDFIIDLGEL